LSYIGGLDDLNKLCGACGVPCFDEDNDGSLPNETPPFVSSLVGALFLVALFVGAYKGCKPAMQSGICASFCSCCCPKDGSAWWLEGATDKNPDWRNDNEARVQRVRVFENQRQQMA
jgi:hypothetical protein